MAAANSERDLRAKARAGASSLAESPQSVAERVSRPWRKLPCPFVSRRKSLNTGLDGPTDDLNGKRDRMLVQGTVQPFNAILWNDELLVIFRCYRTNFPFKKNSFYLFLLQILSEAILSNVILQSASVSLKKTTPLEGLALKRPEALKNWSYKQKKMWALNLNINGSHTWPSGVGYLLSLSHLPWN